MASLGSSPVLEDISRQNNEDWREVFTIVGYQPSELGKTRAFMQLRRTPESLGIFLDLSSPYNGMIIDPDKSLLRITVPVWHMQNITPGQYVRDVLLKTRGGSVLCGGRGLVTILQGITQDVGQLEGWLKI